MLHQDPRKLKLDLTKFHKSANELEVKYGLPRHIDFCTKCVISNQRPSSGIEQNHKISTKKETIRFHKDGICDACKVSESKNIGIDWAKREHELRILCDKYRSRNGSYDCLVPGSGGKDSFVQSWILRYEFQMNPLTVTWAPNLYTDWGRINHTKWIDSGFDNYLFTPNGKVRRILTRLAVENLFHPFQPFIIGQKSFAPKLAQKLSIPLIFYGENEAEYGNSSADMESPIRQSRYHSTLQDKISFISGVEVNQLKHDYSLSDQDLYPYLSSTIDDLEKAKIEVHYLGYYRKWHPQENYYFAVENGGFVPSPQRTAGTYSKYVSIDDKIDDLHFYTTFIKFGIGRATYEAAQEIRSGDLERDEAVNLVKRYDGEYPERFIDELFSYLSLPESEFGDVSKKFEEPTIDREYFDALTNKFRSPHIWKFEDGEWALRKTVI